jgi:kynureninase
MTRSGAAAHDRAAPDVAGPAIAAGWSLERCEALDAAAGPLDGLRDRFAPGSPGTLYFDANSIGPMPASAPVRMQAVMDGGWREGRRRSWNDTDWLAMPRTLGARLSRVLGAAPEDVVVCDSTSVNQYKLLRHALQSSGKTTIVVERGVFPSNRYVVEGLVNARPNAGIAWRLIDSPDDLPRALAPRDVAVVALSHVDYRSSERLDLPGITALVHRHDARVLWDLSHSAGALDVALRDSDADYAVGCGYKYLCGGPGAPAFLYVHPRHAGAGWPAICGWMGHADTFAFAPDFGPADGVGRFLVGTPPVLANAAMGAAADLWAEVDPADLHARHRSLTDTLIGLVDERCAGTGIEMASPRDHSRRGGHVALSFGGAQPLSQALVAAGVVVSARKPDALRIAPHPLVTRHVDLWHAVETLRGLLGSAAWRDPRFAGPQV